MEMHQLRSRYFPATLPDFQNGNVNFRQDHVTVWRWVQRYAPKMERRLRSRLKPTNDSWRWASPTSARSMLSAHGKPVSATK
jgi:hypothetical protein